MRRHRSRVDPLEVPLSPDTVRALVTRVYAGFEAANLLAGGLAGQTVTVRGATGEERAWLEVALQACAAELVEEGGEVTVAGSLATRRDRATALSIGDVEAIWTVLGSLSGLAIAPAPVAEERLLRRAA
jgi:hypothetical protein